MPPIDNQDELNIGLGITGFDNVEETIQRLEVLLGRARENIDKIFTGKVLNDAEKFSDHVTSLERKVVSLTSSFAGIGKIGGKGFEDLNKVQLDAFERLTAVQRKLQSIDATLGKDVKPSTLVRRKKEAEELEAELGRLEKVLLGVRPLDIIQKKFALDSPKPVTSARDPEMERAQRDIQRMQNERKLMERQVTQQIETEAEKQYRIRVSTFQRALNSLLKGYRTIEQQEAKLTEKSTGGRSPLEAGLSKLGLGGLGGGLGPFAAIVAGGYAIERAYTVAAAAIERASEQARANRVLAESALEAGVAIETLTEENKKFAQATALSTVAAAPITSKITQLATKSERPEDIGKLLKGFADLAAARGIEPQDLDSVAQQVITGRGPAIKRLLLTSPEQLYKNFVKEEGKGRSVENLSSIEKSQIFQAEFLKKADLFNGAAEARLASVDGRAAKLTASFENLANTLSTKFANNYDVATTIDQITKAFGDLNKEIDDLAGKVERGINIDNLIKEQAAPGVLGYGAAGVRTFLSGMGTLIQGGLNFGTLGGAHALGISQQFGTEAKTQAEAALADVNPNLREDFLRQQVNAEIRVRALNRKAEQERRIQLAADTAKEEQDQLQQAEATRFKNIFQDPRANAKQVLDAIQGIKNYTNVGGYKLDTTKVEQETVKRFGDRDTSLDRGRTQEQLLGDIRTQVTKEMQAAVDQKNLPLFSDEDKRKLLDDGEKILLELAKKAHELVKGVQQDLVGALSEKTDNPFVKLISDAETAAEEARIKFARLGPALAESMAKIAEQTARSRLAIAEFESSDRELGFRQQARRLEQLPATQTNAFERRLQQVETEVQYRLTQQDAARGIVESQFYGTTQATGKARKLREAFLRAQYGDHYQDLVAGARGTREEKDAYREIGVKIKESQKDVEALRRTDTRGLGVYSRGIIAEQLLGRLPTTDELLPRLRGQGQGRAEAQGLFRTRQDLLRDKQAADQQRFKDFIDNQKFIDLNRKDAEERSKNLFEKGGALPEKAKLDKFLQITGELGNAELTPELRQQRIKALNARADIEANEKKTAQDQMKVISDFIAGLQKQVESGGLKVQLAETPIVDVNINASGVTAELSNRPTQNR